MKCLGVVLGKSVVRAGSGKCWSQEEMDMKELRAQVRVSVCTYNWSCASEKAVRLGWVREK